MPEEEIQSNVDMNKVSYKLGEQLEQTKENDSRKIYPKKSTNVDQTGKLKVSDKNEDNGKL